MNNPHANHTPGVTGKTGTPSTDGREFTLRAIVVGVVLGVVFGAANAYLGLKVGLTVSASIPAAVMGVVFFRLVGGNIRESNMVQTIGSAGESLAAGVIFTIPAFFLWQYDPGRLKIFIIALAGGLLGVLMMVPLRSYLIVREHDKLPYPEGTACAEVLRSGTGAGGGGSALLLLAGMLVGGVYQLLSNASFLGLWKQTLSTNLKKRFHIGADLTPELLGIGYIIGPRISALMFGGGCLGSLVLVPIIYMLAEPGGVPADPEAIRADYVKLIGVGAVTAGGIITLIKAIPTIMGSFSAGLAGLRGKNGDTGSPDRDSRRNRDISMKTVLLGVIVIGIAMALLPDSLLPVGLFGAFMIVLFSFFFATVSSRIVGLIGSSSNPVSGMTIATLLITAALYLAATGGGGDVKFTVLSVGAVVCIAAAIAGDTSQDLKTGFLVEATPMYQQLGELIGVTTSAIALAFVIYLFKADIMSGELAAPQANMMRTVIDGVLTRDLEWNLIAAGGALALVVELLGLPSLAFAVGLYLPVELSVPVMAGGAARYFIDGRQVDSPRPMPGEAGGSRRAGTGGSGGGGVLYSSGLIAGAALVGVGVTALVAAGQWSEIVERYVAFIGNLTGGLHWSVSLLLFGILLASLVAASRKKNLPDSSDL